MAYEYEHEHRNMKAGVYSGLATNESVEEIKEVYRKAKAFDEILDIDLAQHDEEYADNVMKVVNKFTEGKND
ncbi:DUF1024 family protein [Staphylococcus saprophyticus]|uniref:DUF1024 family protein n=1 Tax=Staphylococcus saprophyticus TaxID=29385 RepID=UPI001584B04C|nr:DUF1024 family protein [Staphylococcus saprophyticus]MCM3118975.1 DUF1024 family protein [Staphylococcus saprophyticus]QKV11133.1 DUF1024 family protein [Staphylococcus saprophyticus]